jgi:hypothetical protein
MAVVALRAGREREGIGHAVCQSAVRIGLADPIDEPVHQRHALPGLADFFLSLLPGDLPGKNAPELTAVEIPAAHRPLVINAAGAAAVGLAVRGAGLEEKLDPLLATEFQPKGGKLAGMIAGLQLDRMEEDAVTAHAAGTAEAFGGRRVAHQSIPYRPLIRRRISLGEALI